LALSNTHSLTRYVLYVQDQTNTSQLTLKGNLFSSW